MKLKRFYWQKWTARWNVAPRFGAGSRGQVRLEAAREVYDLRISGEHGRDDSYVDRNGDQSRPTRYSTEGWQKDRTETYGYERRVTEGTGQGRS